ncbi:nitrate reductase subunit alpha [Nocardia terpenica]|uniref:nitrate reductase subunit alpha n=1 Tax=Nocardia terpenica TaxID=455432 RepID=UPI001893FD2F|nr:nitrate reductase subunit alpha [Nocardia terpenica]MBF6061361.1 nitrate reductase subunit alpha [Nocardia terpenica]MBF6105410.1 nitrate reductase subunit alpha [Nocardia terpenica]MBF6113120.1 nitrate reductase subunit alpha [Nocardia terpenica]MBF6119250.1 nitrate reductase subunit alpha [Nocardia terpenica]MBF6152898.1 nitrate reductase subunit alpha [Nocardia terpenica]
MSSDRTIRAAESARDAAEAVLRAAQFFFPGHPSPDGRVLYRDDARPAEEFYRERWRHDREIRSTHGVNCTGSCSWKVHVKDGIITWETQATDYPSTGPDTPEYEPRGCPRGASFSWYTYSPARVRYPYVRGVLLDAWRAAKARHRDPVHAWAALVADEPTATAYKRARGRGGFVRSSWPEVLELIAAAHVHTIGRWGPDRIVGFSPIPAMSMVSYAAGTRFLSLIGATISSFYDWYSDLPIASPQVFGDQTDVPESGDWWNAAYLILWGTNLPITRTPDAHFMTEARYRGQKVVVVSPDYSDHTKFADEWLPAAPGTDAALAMAMGHVILTEFHRDRPVPYFRRYASTYTDLPFLITLTDRDGDHLPAKFLTAADLGDTDPAAAFKTVVLDEDSGEPAVPGGSLGFRWAGEAGRWNLRLGGLRPALSLHGRPGAGAVTVALPRFDRADTDRDAAILRRAVPALRIGDHLVTTVFDLVMAQYGVARAGLPGDWPTGYDDATVPYTPAWQEAITGVPAAAATRVAREFARTAERSGGRAMIAMGAGTNHWFHSDQIYRTFLALLHLCGCQGVNGGGWAHYVGQEKVRPLTGWSHLAFAYDWCQPTRHMAGTPLWWLATGQWRYEGFAADVFTSPLAAGTLTGATVPDCHALAARLGWMPSHPTFDRNPLDLCDDADAAGVPVADHIVDQLSRGALRFAAEDPDAPHNYPRVLTVWRANLFASSMKGHEYLLRHLLGTDDEVTAPETPPALRPTGVRWRTPAPVGKLDLSVAIDFRMTSTCLYSDIVLPAATWYEKHDLSSTDMHPFVHSFSPAIAPPWQTRTDFTIFADLAAHFSALAATHLGVRRDVVATPLAHDTPDELAQPHGRVRDWRRGDCDPIPGVTMPTLTVVERDYGAVAQKMAAIGPLLDTAGTTTKGLTWIPDTEIDYLRRHNGVARHGVAAGRPSIARDDQFCEAILALSATTNGRLAVEGFRALERQTGMALADLAEERAGDRITFADTKVQPRAVITSPEWSGSETGGRRYSAFTINVERLKPWHTLTGRQHFFLDHDWIHEFGEALPIYRPPLNLLAHVGAPEHDGRPEIVVRYLTPHSKWSIHSTYQDNLHMLTLFRGGPTLWISPADAAAIGAADNDWIEAHNRNGIVVCRAVVSHRMPTGTVFLYHTTDRQVNVPRTEHTGRRGGNDNSLTRIMIKPTHLIGGYAQFCYGFNYHGPTGPQRDELTVLRRRSQEVDYR